MRLKTLRCAFVACLLAAAAALAPSTAGAAPAPVPCSAIGGGKFECDWYRPGDGISGGSIVQFGGRTVGYLHQGRNWILCQQKGARVNDREGNLNDWYGWTLSDGEPGAWGWASPLDARGGDDFGQFAGAPDCNGAHGPAPSTPGLWGGGGSAPAPPAPAPPGQPAPPATAANYAAAMDRGFGVVPAGDQRVTVDTGVVTGDDGVVVTKFFIPAAKAAGGLLLGDERNWSSDPATAARSRFYVTWDVATGKASVTVTHSTAHRWHRRAGAADRRQGPLLAGPLDRPRRAQHERGLRGPRRQHARRLRLGAELAHEPDRRRRLERGRHALDHAAQRPRGRVAQDRRARRAGGAARTGPEPAAPRPPGAPLPDAGRQGVASLRAAATRAAPDRRQRPLAARGRPARLAPGGGLPARPRRRTAPRRAVAPAPAGASAPRWRAATTSPSTATAIRRSRPTTTRAASTRRTRCSCAASIPSGSARSSTAAAGSARSTWAATGGASAARAATRTSRAPAGSTSTA